MNRGAGGPSHLKDDIASYLDRGGQNGTPASGQSDLNAGAAANNQPARIFIVENDPVMLRMVGAYLDRVDQKIT